MRRFILFVATMAMVFSLSVVSSAQSVTPENGRIKTEMTMLEDGGILTITTVTDLNTTRASGYSGSKTASYKYGGKVVWTYSIHATFSSTGSATGVGDSYAIKDREWSFDSSSTSRSGNTAYGDATFSSSRAEKSVSLSLTCDRQGNIT